MAEKPILFRTEMVRAILADRKWKTRRLFGLEDVNKNPDLWTLHKIGILDYMVKKSSQGKFGAYFHSEQIELNTLSVCPQVSKWQKGDHLWVRETWCNINKPEFEPEIYYRADIDPLLEEDYDSREWKWSSSMFMPKRFARLWLEVLDVKVERVQDISHEDAIAEGIEEAMRGKELPLREQRLSLHQLAFSYYWDTIHKKKPEFQWQANPWVWVYEFRRIER